MWARRGPRDRERHRLPALRAPSEYVVVSVDQLRKHLGLSTALEFGNWIFVSSFWMGDGCPERRVHIEAPIAI